MSIIPIKPFRFNFNGRTSEEFNILCSSSDFLLPEKRMRKQFVPFRDGNYDYGAEFYNDRTLRIRCVWISNTFNQMTRSDIREVAYWLSKKGRIELANEPDKWYMGELYDPTELIAHYTNAVDRGTTDGEFELNFVCEPFAYKDIGDKTIQTGINPINYEGTAQTSCTIILKNNNNFAVNNVQIVVSRRKF